MISKHETTVLLGHLFMNIAALFHLQTITVHCYRSEKLMPQSSLTYLCNTKILEVLVTIDCTGGTTGCTDCCAGGTTGPPTSPRKWHPGEGDLKVWGLELTFL